MREGLNEVSSVDDAGGIGHRCCPVCGCYSGFPSEDVLHFRASELQPFMGCRTFRLQGRPAFFPTKYALSASSLIARTFGILL